MAASKSKPKPAAAKKPAPKKKAPALPKAQSSERYMAEDDVRTLIRAGEIQKDPKRMAVASKVAREQADALKKVTGSKAGKK